MSASQEESEASFALPRGVPWWSLVPEGILIVLTGILPLIVLANVLARYTNLFHVLWAEDVVKVVFLWLVFLGGAVAVKYEAHVRMTVLVDRFAAGNRAGRLWHLALRLSPILVGIILLVFGIRIVEISMLRELPTLRISAGYFATIVPISGVLMIVYVVHQVFWKAARAAPSGE